METREVQPDGSLQSKIALVGEAPGATEVALGKGFMGMSGKLLWDIIGSYGITRDDCYVTNTIKIRPSNDELDSMISFRAGKVKTSNLYVSYEERLHEEIKAFEGNVIVAIGGVSLYALTRKIGITKWRGSILPCIIGGKKVIPIIHPAAALREYKYQNIIRLDWARIFEEKEFPDIRLPIRRFTIEPTFSEVMSFLESVKRECVRVGFDIEVYNNELSCFSLAVSAEESFCIPLIRGNGIDYFSLEQEVDIMKALATILQDKRIVKIGQNLAFDNTFMYQKYGIVVENIEDTMIAQAIAFPDYPKGLDFITSVYTKEPYYKDEGKKYFKGQVNDKEFWEYNAKDSVVCVESFPKIIHNVQSLKNSDTYREQRDLIPSLTYMQARGIKVDVEGLNNIKEITDRNIKELSQELNKICGYEINHGSPKQLKEYFYDKQRIKPYLKDGKPSTDEIAMKRLARKGYKEASLVLELRHLSKMKGTYFDVSLDKDNRLRCSFNPVGTKQGRLSSSETIFGTGTNMQNLPDEFRKFLIADENNLIFNLDLSQAENRIVAYTAPEPAMIEAFEKKIDVHSLTASLISGLPIDEVKRQDKEKTYCNLGGGTQTWRFWGKKANHGLNYDLGYKAFSLLYEIPESDGKYIVEKYHQVYPGVRQYHAWIRQQLFKDRTLTNLLGRRRLFIDRWGDQLFKEAYSFIPQSSVADIVNRRWLNNIQKNQYKYYPVDLILQVHDSITIQMDYSKYSWKEIAEVLLHLVNDVEQPLEWQGRKFVIPSSLEVGINMYKKDMVEVDVHGQSIDGLARRLYEIYGELRAS